jgi:hypothetical protein
MGLKIIVNKVVKTRVYSKLRSVSKQYNDYIKHTIKFFLKMAQLASKHVGEY